MNNQNHQGWTLVRDKQGIAWLHFDKPDSRVNTLSAAVLLALDEQLTQLEQSPPLGLIIVSDKSNGFIAGADVVEFTQLSNVDAAYDAIHRGQTVFNHLEQLPFPTLALIHGFCLGGGLELALACRHRVARDDTATRLGLPEVRLGIHPGFGGSVRLTELLGAIPAMNLMLTGRSIDGRQAKKMGLVDEVVPQRHLHNAARQRILKNPPARTPGRLARLSNHSWVRPLLARSMSSKTAAKAPRDHYPAPHALIDLWRRFRDDRPAMLREEARSVAHLIVEPTAQQLVRLFLLQDRLKGLAHAKDFPVRHVHVIGAGVMGGDIAAWCALQGYRVSLQDQTPERIAPAMGRAAALFKKKRKRPRPIQEAMDRLIADHRGLGVAQADVIIEAIFEDAEVKRSLFRQLEPQMKPDAILCSNTSSIPLEDLAAVLQRPERLVGLHFFNPVAQMQLVEIVRGTATDDVTLFKAMAFTRGIDRLPLPVRSTPGFLVNRILMPYLLEAVTLYSEGISAEIIDAAALRFGMPMGPITLADTVGLDVCLHVAGVLSQHMPVEIPDVLRQKVAAGKLGRKSNEGFYRYRQGKVVTHGKASQYDAHAYPHLQDRLILRMLNEAMACLREGVVEDADLLDAGMVFGTGFAPFRGGPMQHVDRSEAERLQRRLLGLEQQFGERFHPDTYWDKLITDSVVMDNNE